MWLEKWLLIIDIKMKTLQGQQKKNSAFELDIGLEKIDALNLD